MSAPEEHPDSDIEKLLLPLITRRRTKLSDIEDMIWRVREGALADRNDRKAHLERQISILRSDLRELRDAIQNVAWTVGVAAAAFGAYLFWRH